jgi:hypothetical protein
MQYYTPTLALAKTAPTSPDTSFMRTCESTTSATSILSIPCTCASASCRVLGMKTRVMVSSRGGTRYLSTREFSDGECEEIREKIERWRSSDAVNLWSCRQFEYSVKGTQDIPIIQPDDPPILYFHLPSPHTLLHLGSLYS